MALKEGSLPQDQFCFPEYTGKANLKKPGKCHDGRVEKVNVENETQKCLFFYSDESDGEGSAIWSVM